MNKEILNTANKAKTNFLYSFSLLPKEKNEAIKTVYAFCRRTDDIVDDENLSLEERRINIDNWRIEFENALNNNSDNTLLNNLISVINKFKIPHEPFFGLIDGMKQDLETYRYLTSYDLLEYCYKAASTVGLMSIEIFGYHSENAKDYAVNLGKALQLTNILRDVKQDALNGRIYIPQDDMKKFDYNDNDIIKNVYNLNFIELMKHECNLAKSYYQKAQQSLTSEDRKLLFPAVIMQKIYYNILTNIEKLNYNVFTTKARVSDLKKVYLTLSVYLRSSI